MPQFQIVQDLYTGKFSAYLASKGVKAYAMDLEQAMVEQAKELSKQVSPRKPKKVVDNYVNGTIERS